MKKSKKIILIVSVMAILTLLSITGFATTQYTKPADVVAGLTGRDLQSVLEERSETGKSYGTIAKEAGVLEEFKEAVYQRKAERLKVMVEEGRISQEDSEMILSRIKERQALCDGTGNIGSGYSFGRKQGNTGSQGGLGLRNGGGSSEGLRLRDGSGQGMRSGLRDRSCFTTP